MYNPTSIAAENEEEDSCIPQRTMVKKMASLLVKPKVSFVSLVGHAANGLAFSMVKDEDGIANLNQPTTSMPKTTTATSAAIPSFGSAGASLNRLEFDCTVFKTEADVRNYLTESNITATRILKTDTHFIVPGVSEKSLDNIEMVKGDKDGVTYWIGKLKANLNSIKPPSPEDPTKRTALASGAATSLVAGTQANPKTSKLAPSSMPTTPIRKGEKSRLRGDEDFDHVFKAEAAPELRAVVQKMDSYMAKQLKLTDLEDVLATGEASLPGFYDIARGIELTVQNIVSSSKPSEVAAKIRAAFEAGGDMAAGLANVFITSEEEEGVEKFEIARDLARTQFSSPKSGAASAVAGDGVVKKAEGEVKDLPALVAKAVKDAIAGLESKVGEIADGQEELRKSVTETSAELETRLVGLEEVRQVRKSVPDDGDTTVAKSDKEKQEEVRKADKLKKEEAEKKKDDEFASKQARSRLGLR